MTAFNTCITKGAAQQSVIHSFIQPASIGLLQEHFSANSSHRCLKLKVGFLCQQQHANLLLQKCSYSYQHAVVDETEAACLPSWLLLMQIVSSLYAWVYLYFDAIVYDRILVTQKLYLVSVCHILLNSSCYGVKGNFFVSQARGSCTHSPLTWIPGLLIFLTCISFFHQAKVANIQ